MQRAAGAFAIGFRPSSSQANSGL